MSGIDLRNPEIWEHEVAHWVLLSVRIRADQKVISDMLLEATWKGEAAFREAALSFRGLAEALRAEADVS